MSRSFAAPSSLPDSTYAQSKQLAAEKAAYAISFVDEGAIRTQMIEKLGADRISATKAQEFVKERNEATQAESAKQTDAPLNDWYEPFTASVYGDSSYCNEKVWLFRKRIH